MNLPTPQVLEIFRISKQFGSLHAVKDISFSLARGEVLALLGENGAGKTTLMNILFGHYLADQGEIRLDGSPMPQGSPAAALQAGIGMVHQHFTLGDNLTVLENILLGTEPLRQPFHRERKAREQLDQLSDRFGLKIEPDKKVANLSVGEKQRVEILKALYRDARMLILDEPTAVLTPQESVQLFAALRTMVKQGMSIIFISHKLAETFSVADRVVVLRRGELVGTFDTSETSAVELAQAMVGRQLPEVQRKPSTLGSPVIELARVKVRQQHGSDLENINLKVCAGEIVGIAGVSGNGQKALTSVLSGNLAPDAGNLQLNGQNVPSATPRAFISAGIARIPEDRSEVGIVGDMTVAENLILEDYRDHRFSRAGWMRWGHIEQYATTLCSKFDVRGAQEVQRANELSGGNIQKLILARVLSKQPKLIIASQPTRGLDVGAQAEVHQRLLDAKHIGVATYLVSEDLEELFKLCDRIHVMFEGRLSDSIAIENADINEIGLMMTGKSKTGSVHYAS